MLALIYARRAAHAIRGLAHRAHATRGPAEYKHTAHSSQGLMEGGLMGGLALVGARGRAELFVC